MEATRKVGLYESMVKRPGGVVYKLAGIEALFTTPSFDHHKKFKTFEEREEYIEKFFKGLTESILASILNGAIPLANMPKTILGQ